MNFKLETLYVTDSLLWSAIELKAYFKIRQIMPQGLLKQGQSDLQNTAYFYPFSY